MINSLTFVKLPVVLPVSFLLAVVELKGKVDEEFKF